MSALMNLAEWARATRPSDLPEDVLRLARLQHVAAAGAARAAAATAEGAALLGGAALPDAHADAHASLLARFEYDDFLLAGRTGLGAVPLPWSLAKGRKVEDLLAATVIGNEIGGRVGLAMLLGPRGSSIDTHVPAAAGAAAAAWLSGLDAAGIAGAVSAAVGEGQRLSPADVADDPAAIGRRPAQAAQRALRAPRGQADLLEASSPFWQPLCDAPLMGAFGGLGSAWLTRTLVLKPQAVMAWACVPVQAVAEILARHVKAAEKRLRPDQIERIEVRVGLLPWAMDTASGSLGEMPAAFTWSLKRAIGTLVTRHDLRPADLTAAALAERQADIADVAARVEIVHDWSLTVATLEHFTRVLGPLFADLGAAGLRGVRQRLRDAGSWPALGPEDVLPLVKARPDRVLRNLRARPGDLGDVDLAEFKWHQPVEVKLYTTRGGWWPERRAVPRGTVPAGDIEAVALGRHGGEAAGTLLATRGDADAATWVQGLLA